jgi:uncharacterized protein
MVEKLIGLLKEKYNNGDPSHDFSHIMRVVDSCKKIGAEVGADLDILIPAALLHDVVNVPKNHPDRVEASRLAADQASIILRDLNYSDTQISKIAVVIVEHSYSRGLKPSCIESAVLQDADRLDAVGAIGTMRAVTCGAKLGSSYYDMTDPFAKERDLNDKNFTLDHFFTKLFKLGDGFNTEPAKIEGLRRIQFMKDFVAQFSHEIGQK